MHINRFEVLNKKEKEKMEMNSDAVPIFSLVSLKITLKGTPEYNPYFLLLAVINALVY